MTSSTLLQILQKKYKSVQSIPVIVKIIAPFHNYYHIMGLYNYHNNFLSGHKGPKNLPRQEWKQGNYRPAKTENRCNKSEKVP